MYCQRSDCLLYRNEVLYKRINVAVINLLSLAQFFLVVCENPRWSDWSTHFYLTNLIGWLFCDVLGIGLCRSAKAGQKSCFERVVFDAPYLGQFLSDFVPVKSKVSPRPSTLTCPIFENIDFWPNYRIYTTLLGRDHWHHTYDYIWQSTSCTDRGVCRSISRHVDVTCVAVHHMLAEYTK